MGKIYTKNISERGGKKIILSLFETENTKTEEKISQKVPVKGLPPSSYEALLFSCDCAMFFNIGYFI